MIDIQKIGNDNDPIATDIDLESNVKKNTKLSTSSLVARQFTENPDDMVDAEEEMSSEDLTITGNYSDYNILEEEKVTITKTDNVWGKNKKRNMERESTLNSLKKKRG